MSDWLRALALAELDDCYGILSTGGRGAMDRRQPETIVAETLAWITSRRTDAWSFACVCDLLDLDADATRRALLRLAANPPGRRVQFDWRAVAA